MHIPASMLQGAICPVTAAVAAGGLGVALYAARKSEEKPSVARFAAITSLIFALQMLNYPIQNGTSGHLLGGVLAFSLLGLPLAVLSMAVVLAVQCVFFGDGGLNALGANILNMAFIGTAAVGFLLRTLMKTDTHKFFKIFAASWASVMLAAFACSVEVAIAGAVNFSKAVFAMLATHALIGVGEGLLTGVLVCGVFASQRFIRMNEKAFAAGTFILAMAAASLSPFASSFPDGLEWVAGKLSFAEFKGFEIAALFPDYQVLAVSSEGLSTILAGFIGIVIVSLLSVLIGKGIGTFSFARR